MGGTRIDHCSRGHLIDAHIHIHKFSFKRFGRSGLTSCGIEQPKSSYLWLLLILILLGLDCIQCPLLTLMCKVIAATHVANHSPFLLGLLLFLDFLSSFHRSALLFPTTTLGLVVFDLDLEESCLFNSTKFPAAATVMFKSWTPCLCNSSVVYGCNPSRKKRPCLWNSSAVHGCNPLRKKRQSSSHPRIVVPAGTAGT